MDVEPVERRRVVVDIVDLRPLRVPRRRRVRQNAGSLTRSGVVLHISLLWTALDAHLAEIRQLTWNVVHVRGALGTGPDLLPIRLRALAPVRIGLHRLVYLGIDLGREKLLRVRLALVLVRCRARAQLPLRLGDLEVPGEPTLNIRSTEEPLVVGRVQSPAVARVDLGPDAELERGRPAPAGTLEDEEARAVDELLLRIS